MYIPKYNQSADQDEAIAFMTRFSFATIVTSKNNAPTASHLPFTISKRGENLVLTSHFAKANPQWADLENNTALVVFTEPHAYISPKHYDKELSVPTWNYIAIHAYGTGKIITDEAASFKVLEDMIDSYDADYKQQWNKLPADYKLKMLNGITPFEIEVTDLQIKNKLSQNRSDVEQKRIVNALSKSDSKSETQLAYYMKRNLEARASK